MMVAAGWCLSPWWYCWLVSHSSTLLWLPSLLMLVMLVEIVVFLHSHHGLNLVLVLPPWVVVLHFALCQALGMGVFCGNPLTWTYARGFVFPFFLPDGGRIFLQCNVSLFF
jgi:hypothetical protein